MRSERRKCVQYCPQWTKCPQSPIASMALFGKVTPTDPEGGHNNILDQIGAGACSCSINERLAARADSQDENTWSPRIPRQVALPAMRVGKMLFRLLFSEIWAIKWRSL